MSFLAASPGSPGLRSSLLRVGLSSLALLVSSSPAPAAPGHRVAAQGSEFREPVLAGTWGGCEPDEIGPLGLCFGSDKPGEFQWPTAIAVDDSGFVYVSEPVNGRTQKFTADGALVDVWPGYAPPHMKWGPGNVLWVVVGSTIRWWDRDGNDVGGFGQAGSGPGEFLNPRAVDFDAEGHVLVLDAGNNRVQRFTVDGEYLGEWGITPLWITFDRLAMLVLPDQSVLISDRFSGFQRFNADGVFLDKWAPQGGGDGQFRQVAGMTLGADGNAYVADTGNSRIQVMTPDGRYVGQWGGLGSADGQFLSPVDIARYGDFLYVADRAGSAVHAYSFHTVVTTKPPGLRVVVDGVESTSPVVVDWKPGTPHVIEAMATLEGDGRRLDFAAWNDGGSIAHTVEAPVKPGRFTAVFDEFFWMEMSGEPGATFTPGSRWVPAEDPVEIHAMAPPGYVARWIGTGRGSYTGHFPGALVRAEEPVTQHAVLALAGSVATLTISASDTDPYVQTAATAGGLRPLHLWLACASDGVSAFEAQTTGSLTPIAFDPAPGILNAGSAEHLFLAIGGCPSGAATNVRIGTWTVVDFGGDLCLGETTDGVFAWADCSPVTPGILPDPELRGFSSAGTPCMVGSNGCPPPPALAFSTGTEPALLAAVFGLASPRPNPFRDRATFLYTLPAPADVRVSVFDVVGRLVRRLDEGRRPGGAHEVSWDGRTGNASVAPAGVYFVRLEAGGRTETRKVTRLGAR